jgi:hypothetical protein
VDPIEVFGLRAADESTLRYEVMDDALETGRFEMREIDTQGSINEVYADNRLDLSVFIMLGDEVVGAKQDRVFVSSFMVPAGEQHRIPVACVEQGRWRYSSAKFGSRRRSSHARLKARLAQMSDESFRCSGRPAGDQDGVWSEVDRKLLEMRVASPTGALDRVYDDHQHSVDDFLARIQGPDDCCGVAFCIEGRVSGIDLFDQRVTLRKQWAKLVRAHLIDALEPGRPSGPPAEEGTLFSLLSGWDESPPLCNDLKGLGKSVRFGREGYLTSALVVDGVPVHIAVYPTN